MKIKIKNLGKITEAEFALNKLTVLVGDNNSGKTYITYSTYGALKSCREAVDLVSFHRLGQILKKEGQLRLSSEEMLNIISELKVNSNVFNRQIKNIFNDKEAILKNASISIKLDELKNPDTKRKKTTIEVGGQITFLGEMLHDGNLLIHYSIRKGIKPPSVLISDLIYDLIIRDIFFDQIIILPTPTIITAERLGISLFYKELDETKNSLIETLQKMDTLEKENVNKIDYILNRSAYYAVPIRDHISAIRNLDTRLKHKSSIAAQYAFELITKILGGELKKEESQDIRFYNEDNKFDIPLYLASSSVRCIVDIYFYLKHDAKPGDVLIIDEPESHLTLHNQRQIAKLLVAITTLNIKVFITTHSDFLIKELNNLILLANDFPTKKQWLEKNKSTYTEHDNIKYEDISIFEAKEGKLEPIKITAQGIETKFFDEQILDFLKVATSLEFEIDSKE